MDIQHEAAFHEAGRAVAATLLHVAVKRVTIVPEEGSEEHLEKYRRPKLEERIAGANTGPDRFVLGSIRTEI